jgi:hypothetical protein
LNETYRKVRIDKQLSNTFPVQNGRKQGNASPPLLLLGFSLEYGVRKVKENEEELEPYGAHQFTVCAFDI